MKENMFDVLMYLFENHAKACNWASAEINGVVDELTSAGFAKHEIDSALDWLEGLSEFQKQINWPKRTIPSTRVYTEYEMERLSVEARGFIHFLEQVRVLNPVTRELVLDRAVALNTKDIQLSQLKWLTLIVLFSYPGQEAQLAWMEEYILDVGKSNGLH